MSETAAPVLPWIPAATLLPRHVWFLVAGAAGGVGTTTLAALLATALAARTGVAPRLVDHTGGVLAGRISTALVTSPHTVQDIGPFAADATRLLASPNAHPVIVTSPERDDADTAMFALQTLTGVAPTPAPLTGAPPHPHGIIVINSTSRRRSPQAAAGRLARIAPGAPLVALEWDPALAVPGPIDPATLAPPTTDALAAILRAFGV